MKYSVPQVAEPRLKSPQIPGGRPLCGRDKNAERRTEAGRGSRPGTSRARVQSSEDSSEGLHRRTSHSDFHAPGDLAKRQIG